MKHANVYASSKTLFATFMLSAIAVGCGGGGDGRDPILGSPGGIVGIAPAATIFGVGAPVPAVGGGPPVAAVSILASAAKLGVFAGTAGMTNTGIKTVITGSGANPADIATTATTPTAIKGFHDSAGDIYTETPANIGNVTGKIYTCTNSSSGPTVGGVNAQSCSIATQAALDARTAYNTLKAQPVGPYPGAGNLAKLTLAPGVYTAATSFKIEGGDLTLDAKGDANAVWVFQMGTSLTVGGPGVAFPQSIILANGAQAKNVYWQVGSAATINAAGGGTMIGTIISQAGTSFSTADNAAILNLTGRAMSLDASVTMVNTAITVP